MKINIAEILAEILAEITTEAAKKSNNILKYTKMLNELKEAGVDVSVNRWDVKSCATISIKRADLTKVRGVVGRLKAQYKAPTYDFDNTNELIVTVKPANKQYDFVFSYRTKYRKGGRCEVITTTSPEHSNYTMVCKK